MALWNPFNLFKKKEAKPENEPVASPEAQPAESAQPESPPAEIAAEAIAPPTETPKEPASEKTQPAKTGPATTGPESDAPVAADTVATETAAKQSEANEPEATETEPSSPDVNVQKPSTSDQSTANAEPATAETATPEIVTQEISVENVNLPETSPTAATEAQPLDDQNVIAPVASDPETEVKSDFDDSADTPGDDDISPDRLVPFDQQVAPEKPVDLYDKISQKPTVDRPAAKVETEAAGGLTGWFRSAISKTAKVLNTDIRDLVGRDGRLVDDAFLKELFTHLIKTDMGVGPATEIRDAIAKKYRARKVHLSELIAEAKNTISDIMKQEEVRLQLADSGTTVIMVVGVNGSGKTTSIAKLASMFRRDGLSVVLGAGDTFRAAAVEQLRQWAGRIGADIVTGADQSDPASVAYKAAQFAKEKNADICIIDTAGRLQTQTHLMQELAKIRRVLEKVIPGAPHETLLVLDSTAGQNAISQARGFSDAANCTGIVLAKLDGTAKGGVAIPIRKEFNLPVKFIGFGETADAIAPFDVPRYVDALFNFDQ